MIYKGRNLVPQDTEASIESSLNAGATLFRFQLAPYQTLDASDWYRQVSEHSEQLAALTERFPAAKFIASLHRESPAGDGHTVAGWAEAYSVLYNSKVFGFSLINEPAGKVDRVLEVQRKLLTSVFRDESKRVMVVSAPYSDPLKYGAMNPIGQKHMPIAKKRIWYDVHMYLPLALTHQGVYQYPPGRKYPTERLNKDRLKFMLRYARQFQYLHRAKMFLGEFGISEFADYASRYAYTRDVIAIAEEYGWHWTCLVADGAEWNYPWRTTGELEKLLEEKWKSQ